MYITNDNKLWGVGSSEYGESGNGNSGTINTPYNSFSDIKSVSASFRHTMIIKDDDTLWGFGSDSNNVMGDGDQSTSSHFTAVNVASDVAKIFCGANHTIMVKTNSDCYSVGANSQGQLGLGIFDSIEIRVFSKITLTESN
ncbi:MAG: hypothetical protein EOL97_04220 [Spirochaetia bacterium]|nr:hypothetical protein [Spirochaetia bacterium]